MRNIEENNGNRADKGKEGEKASRKERLERELD